MGWIVALAVVGAALLSVLALAGSGLIAAFVPGLVGADGPEPQQAAAVSAAPAPASAPPSAPAPPPPGEPDDGVAEAPAEAAEAPAEAAIAPDPTPSAPATPQPSKPAPSPQPTQPPRPTPRPPPAPAAAPAPAPAAAPTPAPAAASAPAPAPTYSTRPPDMDVGKLIIGSDITAEVRVDGELRGTTPITIRLEPGPHTFEAMVPGHPETVTGGPVNVEAGKTYQLNLKFKAE